MKVVAAFLVGAGAAALVTLLPVVVFLLLGGRYDEGLRAGIALLVALTMAVGCIAALIEAKW